MKKYLMAAACACLLASCGGSQQSEGEEVNDSPSESAPVSGVQHISDYFFSDTLSSGGHTYVYVVERHPSDSLGIVTDEEGEKFADNYIDLSIQRDGSNYFKHRFLKREFRSSLSKGFNEQAILDGIAFDRVTPQGMRFSICISYPNSDMFVPFAVTIASDGSYSFVQDDVLDESGNEMESDEDGV